MVRHVFPPRNRLGTISKLHKRDIGLIVYINLIHRPVLPKPRVGLITTGRPPGIRQLTLAMIGDVARTLEAIRRLVAGLLPLGRTTMQASQPRATPSRFSLDIPIRQCTFRLIGRPINTSTHERTYHQ